MSDRLEPIGEIIQAPKIDSQLLFHGLDVDRNTIFKAVSDAIDLAEEAADRAKGNITKCQKTNSFNIEGAVALPNVGLIPDVWLGLRSPLVSLKQKDYAILIHLRNLSQLPLRQAEVACPSSLNLMELHS
ncbi:hypothetical protein IQ238_07970 [Pleurocapsales cyanobacterium LEGE 06147]|nr:hypothetical protein [Pleurocapsales cyanobacterium LEGE 06147]